MSWRERLQPASWRGIRLEVSNVSGTFGRRTVVHEYPGRDEPFAEDLGRAKREIELSGFLIGEDYDRDRDRLIAAAERAGSGILVHPYLGRLRANLVSFGVDESRDEGGQATVRLRFLEAGARRFPTVVRDEVENVQGRSVDAQAGTASSFASRFQTDGFPGWVGDAAIANLLDKLDPVYYPARFLNQIDDLAAVTAAVNAWAEDVPTLIDEPEDLANGLVDAWATAEVFGFYREIVLAWQDNPDVTSSSRSLEQAQQNELATVRLYRRAGLVLMANETPNVPVASYDEALALRDEVAGLLDEELLEDDLDDDAFGAFSDLKAAVVAELDDRATDLAVLEEYTPPATVPSLVVAQRLYGTADSREPEIVERNAIRHPLFTPGAVPLLVLSQ